MVPHVANVCIYHSRFIEPHDKGCGSFCSIHLVIRFDEFARLLGLKNSWVCVKALHRAFDSPEKMPGPEDVPSNGRHVSRRRGKVLVALIGILDGGQLLAVVVKNDRYLRAQSFRVR